MTSTMSKVFCSHLVQAFIEALLGGMVHNQATPMKLIPTGQPTSIGCEHIDFDQSMLLS